MKCCLLVIYFIFIFLTHRKVTEMLIHKTSSYFYLFLDMTRYCRLLKLFYFVFSFIEKWLKFSTACQDHQAGEKVVKCLSKRYNGIGLRVMDDETR